MEMSLNKEVGCNRLASRQDRWCRKFHQAKITLKPKLPPRLAVSDQIEAKLTSSPWCKTMKILKSGNLQLPLNVTPTTTEQPIALTTPNRWLKVLILGPKPKFSQPGVPSPNTAVLITTKTPPFSATKTQATSPSLSLKTSLPNNATRGHTSPSRGMQRIVRRHRVTSFTTCQGSTGVKTDTRPRQVKSEWTFI